MREIVTLQFGQQANYIGTHYWNTQESYFTYAGQEESPVDHDVSFRAGVGANGEDTYTPRTLIYDLKGAFGTLRRENALYQLQQHEDPTQEGGWGGATLPLRLSAIAPSAYQQALEQGAELPHLTTETVRFWSDYNHLYYHPRSIVQLNEYELNSSLMPFERWRSGEDLFADLDREHDLLDRDLRPFLEECDQLQGLQLISGIDDAWGGFAASYLERISDDLGKGCRWVFGLQDGKRTSREHQHLQTGNTAQSVYALDSSASIHIPITSLPSLPGYVSLGPASRWYTSALQAAMLESATLPTRLRQNQDAHATFDRLETTLSNEGNRRLAAASLSASTPSGSHQHDGQINGRHDPRMANGLTHEDEESRHDEGDQPDIDFFEDPFATRAPASQARAHVFTSVHTVREDERHADDDRDADPDSFGDGPRTATYRSSLLWPMLPSYPPLFSFAGRGSKVALRAGISMTTAVSERVRALERSARRVVGIDEREALCDGLVTIAEEYEDGWSDDEDYGED